MGIIDDTANQFYTTKDKKHFNKFVHCATPIIKKFISKSCIGSNWDADELFSILLVDMWRLFNSWHPVEGKQFHWLMLRQLRNKIINYIHTQTGRPHKICPVCNVRQDEQSLYCHNCKSSLRISNIIISDAHEFSSPHFSDFLTEIANKQLVSQLLSEVKNDPKTHRILIMLLEGESKTTISAAVGIAQNAINNRLKKCQKIISRLMEESNAIGRNN
jgi:RNA polymerase sigma factor (sigma-70 family)